jgi:hypothetical protein
MQLNNLSSLSSLAVSLPHLTTILIDGTAIRSTIYYYYPLFYCPGGMNMISSYDNT